MLRPSLFPYPLLIGQDKGFLLSWRTEWKAISDRIEGLLTAGQFYVQVWQGKASKNGTIRNVLLPHAVSIFEQIKKYKELYSSNLSVDAQSSIEQFISNNATHFTAGNTKEIDGLRELLVRLVSFCAEFTFKLSNIQEVAKRITERAFEHLKRSIIADESIKSRWIDAFNRGELYCEKLGAAHLLLHGIWAFKAHAVRERTDLILGEPLMDLSIVESTAEALVLTEWKVVRNDLNQKAKEAYAQAKLYGEGSLAGFELAGYRYLVLVSEDRLKEIPSPIIESEVTYKYINIPVNPSTPSAKTR